MSEIGMWIAVGGSVIAGLSSLALALTSFVFRTTISNIDKRLDAAEIKVQKIEVDLAKHQESKESNYRYVLELKSAFEDVRKHLHAVSARLEGISATYQSGAYTSSSSIKVGGHHGD